MNLSVQKYTDYNFQNGNRTYTNTVNFESKVKTLKTVSLPEQIKPSRVRAKSADILTKLSLAIFRLAEKILKKGKIDSQNQEFESAKIIRTLTKELNLANGKIEQIIKAHENEEINPVKRERIYDEIINSSLNYDPMEPFFKTEPPMYEPKRYKTNYADIKTGTSNRADMQPLEIPKIDIDGSFYFELPEGEMKIKKVELKELKEPFEIQSNISDKYNDSLAWNTDKIVRDLLQNFFDGHGQTLDGVKFIFTPAGLGKYKVRIEGKSTYNYKEAVLLGESSSHDNIKAAGNYGEGLKMVTLKLLMGNKASDVKIGAGNWEVTCGLKKDERLDSEVMNYRIEPVEEFDGNYIEFETKDRELLKTIRTFINRFYHSSNPHFKEPDFENDLFGFKILPEGEKGGLYISGQQFEYEGRYNNVPGGAIFIKEKIPTEFYDVSRDRVSVTSVNWAVCISDWLERRTKSMDECKQIIKALEPFALKDDVMGKLLDQFVEKVGGEIYYQGAGAIKFPDNYVALNTLFPSIDLIHDLQSHGYKVFPQDYEKLGMKSVTNVVNKSNQHTVFKPTKNEETRILILKKALNLFSNLNKYFSKEELDTKVYLFDAKSEKENSVRTFEHVQAQAIIDDKKSKGFYIDREYLNKSCFAEILECALHELSHKAGGDTTDDFSYKLTDVNEAVLKHICDEPKIAEELRILSDIWNKL